MNTNSYYNEHIDFYIEKPDNWVFFPTPWAMNVRKKAALSNNEIRQIIEQAKQPFVYMQKPSNHVDIAYPTVQATCRYFPTPDAAIMESVLQKQLKVFEQQFSDYRILDYSSKNTVSDCPANFFKVSFSIKNEVGTVFKCLSQSWVIFSYDIAYTVGLSGSTEKTADYQKDHNFILNSILIGKNIVRH